jgi:NAD-dependent dihydropyrimidine dehydrogenase PreA subunit
MDAAYQYGKGAPYIDPQTSACTLCEGILCTTSCPTNALIPTLLENVSIGLAVWQADACLRTTGTDCTTCVDNCPIREKAIRVSGNGIEVLDPGCVGCGLCEYHCPSYPKSIVVTAKSAMG